MSKQITEQQIRDLAVKYNLQYASLKAVLEVESGGNGFHPTTGRIIIQFEPHWFRRLFLRWKNSIGIWNANKVENQTKEWEAFNDAFKRNPNAAMQATSIGLMQVMGFHWKLLGFKSVGEMWDYAKVNEANQLDLGLRFIKSNTKMYQALQRNDFAKFAFFYNGQQYKKFNYDTRLAAAYRKYAG